MKRKLIFSLMVIPLDLSPSCMTTTQVANVNMISTRNIDKGTDYKLLSSYQGETWRRGNVQKGRQIPKGQVRRTQRCKPLSR